MFKLVLEKAEEPEIKLPISAGSWKSKRVPEKHLCVLLTTPKPLCESQKLRKILQEMEIPDHLTCLLTNLYAGQEATVRTGHGIRDWFNLGKEYIKAVSEKVMAPHSSTLAWKIPWTEEPGRLQSMGSLRVGHDWANSLSLFTSMHWRRNWQPTPVFLPGESQGRGAWWAAVCGVTQSWTWLKRLSSSSSRKAVYFHPVH